MCRGRDLNSHDCLGRWVLNPLRLPFRHRGSRANITDFRAIKQGDFAYGTIKEITEVTDGFWRVILIIHNFSY